MRIHRCICTRQSFDDLLAQAHDHGWSLEQLAAATGAGTHCGLCRAYLQRGLRTGETEFHEILRDQPEPTNEPR